MVESGRRHAPPGVSPCRPQAVSAAPSPAPSGARAAIAALGPRTPRPYRAPQLTVYGSVRDLTRGSGIGAPDNGVTPSHSMMAPYTYKDKKSK